MSKLSNLLLGPELLWLLFYAIVVILIRASGSPVKSMDSFWSAMAYITPLVLIPLTFMLYYLPGEMRPMLLLRIWIAGLVGGHLVLSRSMEAYSEQGPGIGTAYIMGIIFVLIVLVAGSVWAVIKF